jgi:hypothetical protein
MQAQHGVELPTARRQSSGRGLALGVPHSKLAIDRGGAPLLAGVPRSAP